MKKSVFIILVLVMSVYVFGYAKEEQPTTTLQPSMEMKQSDLMPSPPLKVEDARIKDIQTALMITGYYTGEIDGISGRQTKSN